MNPANFWVLSPFAKHLAEAFKSVVDNPNESERAQFAHLRSEELRALICGTPVFNIEIDFQISGRQVQGMDLELAMGELGWMQDNGNQHNSSYQWSSSWLDKLQSGDGLADFCVLLRQLRDVKPK
jgi:hypothetical protein